MTTRSATMNDLDVITELMNEFHSSPADSHTLRPQLLELTSSSLSDVLLIEDDEMIHGMAIVALLYKLPKIECRINEVIVRASSQGHGYGRALMQACNEWAWDHHADMIEFSSRPSREAANALYQKMGYHTRHTNVYSLEKSLK